MAAAVPAAAAAADPAATVTAVQIRIADRQHHAKYEKRRRSGNSCGAVL